MIVIQRYSLKHKLNLYLTTSKTFSKNIKCKFLFNKLTTLGNLETRGDLIVAGNSSKNLLLRKLFGETALKLLRESPLPLYLAQ